ncbi:MAG TPA: prolyl oligopeptidase family serine peptidase [Pyrinomonadaceae bacterium]|nr:prolyl oligopeptidase family serine peptidase [Pyrinomonadaceae bacterium]
MKFSQVVHFILLVVLFCSANQILRASETNDGSIVERKTYSFPTYEQAVEKTDVEKYFSKQQYQKAVADPHFRFEKLKYMSDGLKVVAYLYGPKRRPGKPLPAIIFNRGGAIRDDIAPELVPFFHDLAVEGFVIVAPMYRQSDGGEGRDEIGGADLDDLMNVIPLVKSLGFIDVKDLFMYGESRGGVMTYQAIKENFPANAAAVFGAFTDLYDLIAAHPDVYSQKMLSQFWPNIDTQRDELIKARSAIYWPERLNVPLLIMNGGNDKGVSPTHSLKLAEQLQKLGKTYELVIYAEDNHYLSLNHEDRDGKALAWFERHRKK